MNRSGLNLKLFGYLKKRFLKKNYRTYFKPENRLAGKCTFSRLINQNYNFKNYHKLSSTVVKYPILKNLHNKKSLGRFSRCLTNKKVEFRDIDTVLVANRGEIAIRVFRAATELNIRTVGIYSKEDSHQTHRLKSDESYLVGEGMSPVAAYMSVDEIIKIAKERKVGAIHPGYGFLSESSEFCEKCIANGIQFIGPTAATLKMTGDKTLARKVAIDCNVPIIEGTNQPIKSMAELQSFIQLHDYPVILKAAHGGGGRGMRKIVDANDIEAIFESAQSEALKSFGNGDLFVEKYIQDPRHIEIQILGDKYGNVVHLHERDCSVQRRHQKVIEVAPSPNIDPVLKNKLCQDAIKIAKSVNYENAGTVEFLLDKKGNYFFIEMNPRLQVEHTVTEEATGIDIVQAQIKLAEGNSLFDIGLDQENIKINACAIQCRLTTEDPCNNFQPNTGRIEVMRYGSGMGIRLDGSSTYSGSYISSHYDSLLLKIISKAKTHKLACQKMTRAINETRVRGVVTNSSFLLNVLKHKTFFDGNVTTSFIDENPELLYPKERLNRAQKLIKFVANTSINGPPLQLATQLVAPKMKPIIPIDENELESAKCNELVKATTDWRNILRDVGIPGFLKQMRDEQNILVTDTTMRDAHQSLLATRIRSFDLLRIAPFVSKNMNQLFSLENWGGATFDVSYRFLKEDPWERLDELRKLIPNIPFQMLVRGASAVGYTNYPDNVVYRFCDEAFKRGIDIFRVFDALNYLPNLVFGIEAAARSGGVVEGALAYTGNILDTTFSNKYKLEYYTNLAKHVVNAGAHILCVKDMAGILRPEAAKILFAALRDQFPHVPIHYHTHDTACVGLINCMIAAEAGIDVVDLAIDSMSGLTSQPCMGSFVQVQRDTMIKCGLNPNVLNKYSNYWEQVRSLYAPFECCTTLKSGTSEAFQHQIPGGQYTNLHFQAHSLGLSKDFDKIKKAYMVANDLLLNIPKVTPTSKVVGDLAQFMVHNNLITKENVLEKANSLSFPESVIQFMRGDLGAPPNGYNEKLRRDILKDVSPNEAIRTGICTKPFNFEKLQKDLTVKYDRKMSESELVSSAMYPQVFMDYLDFKEIYGPVNLIDTPTFFLGLEDNEEVDVEIEKGKLLNIKMISKSFSESGELVECFVRLNGETRSVIIRNNLAGNTLKSINEKAVKNDNLSVGATMPGDVVEVFVSENDIVKRGDKLATLSAMKMETSILCNVDQAKVERVLVEKGTCIESGDLLIQLGKI